ncbi:cytochrome P450 oxidoreductase-like protein [Dendryphion nanum]|uniref:Cytochrome P450 oxidoreductase-like protein n=1 Tax=Dendryphion nanum TaxID=256645 RepID=A0A9P9IIY4_9PLEO|nr:cytochrome P450 oxidoreductase-like protein [Dendryphion nanum]
MAIALCTLLLVFKVLRVGRRPKGIPPGPPTLPLFGNVLSLLGKPFHPEYQKWYNSYGPIYSLKIGMETVIVLYDREGIHQIFNKKSAITSHRPRDLYVDLLTGEENLSQMHATPLWRAQRKVASQSLAPAVLDRVHGDAMEAEIVQLLISLLETPEEFRKHLIRMATSSQSVVVYGNRATSPDDFWASFTYDNLKDAGDTMKPGSYIPPDILPLLNFLPEWMVPAKRRIKACYNRCSRVLSSAVERVEERRKNGILRYSILDRILDGQINMDVQHSRSQLAGFMGALLDAGIGTMMLTHVLWLAAHPEVQEKAHNEIENVCGVERMPVWSDFCNLPYINCIMKEGLRIRPFFAFNVGHRLAEDTQYNGYSLPKDSTLVLPTWGVHHSPEYSDPEVYNPDRYLSHPKLAMDYAGSPDYENRDHYAYGVGRRICPGIHLAERTQWRALAKLLWAYEIKPAIEDGKEVDLNLDNYVEGLVHSAGEFKIRFVPRSEKHVEVMKRAFEDAKEELCKWE